MMDPEKELQGPILQYREDPSHDLEATARHGDSEGENISHENHDQKDSAHPMDLKSELHDEHPAIFSKDELGESSASPMHDQHRCAANKEFLHQHQTSEINNTPKISAPTNARNSNRTPDSSSSHAKHSVKSKPRCSLCCLPSTCMNRSKRTTTSSTSGQAQKPSQRSAVLKFLQSWGWWLLSAAFIALTAYTGVSATWRYAPLAILPRHGVFLLTILSKGGDFLLGLAAGKILSPATGALGLSKIWWHGIRPKADTWKRSWIRLRGKRTEDNNVDHASLWSLARLLAIGLVMVPGLFIMSQVNPKTIYYPTPGISTQRIVGGKGLHSTDLATNYSSTYTEIPTLVEVLLRNPSTSVSAPPISPYCLAGSKCVSYLIPGGLSTVFPWAFAPNIHGNAFVYIIHDAPAYQIDFWDAPSGLDFNPNSCGEYGIFGTVLQLCIASYGGIKGHLVSGYRACSSGPGLSSACQSYSNWDGIGNWTTTMAIYRRTATTTIERSTYNILEYKDLGPPTVQDIVPTDLFVAINGAVLHPRNKTTTECTLLLPQYYTTTLLVSISDLYKYDQAGTTMITFLRNILTVPLYVFNSMMWSSPQSLNISDLDLPKENYVNGTYASSQVREVPEMWTVWVYIGIASGILLVIFGVHDFAMRWDVPERSAFPLLDYEELIQVVDRPPEKRKGDEEEGTGGLGMMRETDSKEIFTGEMSKKWVKVRRH